MTFKPSKYQHAIFDWIVNGRGDAVVEAVAGAGKTLTLVECAKLIHSGNATFLAFNRHIADELQKRLGKTMTAKTIHSVGYSCLRSHLGRLHVDENKYDDICKPFAQEIADDLQAKYQRDLRTWMRAKDDDIPEPEESPTTGVVTGQLKRLAHFVRVTLTDVANRAAVEEVIDRFDCLDDTFTLDMVHLPLRCILREGIRLAENQAVVDYDDMLWLPHVWGVAPSRKCDHVFVDEAQDLSPAQLALVLKMRGRGGRMFFVADRNQAIMGFAGAMADSVDQIIAATQATALPLSICYRCPTSHIKLAQAIVPSIEPAPGAPEGVVEHISRERIPDVIREGDLVISRCTAPAIKLCIELIGKRIPARVKGRDIGKSLTAIVKEVAKHPNFEFKKFPRFLQEYKDAKIAKLEQRRNSESQMESLRDRCEGIQVCYDSFDSKSLGSLCAEIEELFSDGRSSVTLSTVHRAKGLENERVFILRPDQLPLRWRNQQDWELQQESNVKYVALTRAKSVLYFVEESSGSNNVDIEQAKEEYDDGNEDDEDDGLVDSELTYMSRLLF